MFFCVQYPSPDQQRFSQSVAVGLAQQSSRPTLWALPTCEVRMEHALYNTTRRFLSYSGVLELDDPQLADDAALFVTAQHVDYLRCMVNK